MEHSFEMGDEYDGDDSSSEDCSVEFEQGIDHQWMRNDGVDAIQWPTKIVIAPANTDRLEEQAKKMIKRMAERS